MRAVLSCVTPLATVISWCIIRSTSTVVTFSKERLIEFDVKTTVDFWVYPEFAVSIRRDGSLHDLSFNVRVFTWVLY